MGLAIVPVNPFKIKQPRLIVYDINEMMNSITTGIKLDMTSINKQQLLIYVNLAFVIQS